MSNELKDFFNKRTPQNLAKLKKHLAEKNFVLFFLAKKQAGKGTYAKILSDVTDEKIVHISVGDLVREAEKQAQDPQKKDQLIEDLKKYYKGPSSVEKVIDEFIHQAESTNLLPTEAIMALIEKKVVEYQGKSVIIDGFPRSKEQVALATQMQKDFESRGTPSAFVEINCPEEVLLRRYIDRRICPVCQTPKNIKLLLTKEIDYDQISGEFHLVCERPECQRAHYIQKQGDQDGIEKVKANQKKVQEMIDKIKKENPHLHVVVHNSIPLDKAHKHEKSDFTEEANLIWDPEKKEVIRNFKPMIVKDDQGRDAYSRWPEPVVVDLVDRLAEWLEKTDNK